MPSLSDALQEGPQRPVRATFPASLAQVLPPDEYEALQGLLRDSRWSADAISNVLKRTHGQTVHPSTITKWRRANRDA